MCIRLYEKNGVVELPVTISRDAFLRDLEYYGFDETNVDHTYITSTVPAYEAIMKVDKLHIKFSDEMVQLKIEKGYKILAYACFCEFLQKHNLKCIVTANAVTNSDHYNRTVTYKLPLSMDLMDKTLTETFVISGLELMEVAKTLVNTTAVINYDKNMKLFNTFLAEYGFACESVTNVAQHTATITMKPID